MARTGQTRAVEGGDRHPASLEATARRSRRADREPGCTEPPGNRSTAALEVVPGRRWELLGHFLRWPVDSKSDMRDYDV